MKKNKRKIREIEKRKCLCLFFRGSEEIKNIRHKKYIKENKRMERQRKEKISVMI